MKRIVCCGCVALGLVLGAAYAYAQAQPFNVRTGQWEFTMTGMASVLGDLSGLPPEARAQLQAEMKKPQVYKSCITAQDLVDVSLGRVDDNDDDECKTTSKKISATAADIMRDCTGDNKHTEVIHYEATSPQTLRATVISTSAAAKGTLNIAGTWVAAACKDQ